MRGLKNDDCAVMLPAACAASTACSPDESKRVHAPCSLPALPSAAARFEPKQARARSTQHARGHLSGPVLEKPLRHDAFRVSSEPPPWHPRSADAARAGHRVAGRCNFNGAKECMGRNLPLLAGVVCSLVRSSSSSSRPGVMSEGGAAAPPVLLALPGPLFPHVDFRPSEAGACSEASAHGGESHGGERFLINGAPLVLEENPRVSSDSHVVRTAVSVWDCSLMLAKFVEHHADDFRGKVVLELGSGQGVVGIAAAMCGADLVVLTGQ